MCLLWVCTSLHRQIACATACVVLLTLVAVCMTTSGYLPADRGRASLRQHVSAVLHYDPGACLQASQSESGCCRAHAIRLLARQP